MKYPHRLPRPLNKRHLRVQLFPLRQSLSLGICGNRRNKPTCPLVSPRLSSSDLSPAFSRGKTRGSFIWLVSGELGLWWSFEQASRGRNDGASTRRPEEHPTPATTGD